MKLSKELLRKAQRIALANIGITPKAFDLWRDLVSARDEGDGLHFEAPEAQPGEIVIYGAIVSEADAAFQRECWGDESMTTGKMFRDQMNAIEGAVKIRLNSPGGDVWELSTMIQAIDERGSEVSCVVDGLAASAASLLMAACPDVTVARMGNVMIHRAWTCECGNALDFRKTAAMMDSTDTQAAGIYAARTGEKPEKMLELMSTETWYTAKEAVTLGLADRVMEAKKPEDDDDSSKMSTVGSPSASSVEEVNARRARFHTLLALGATR